MGLGSVAKKGTLAVSLATILGCATPVAKRDFTVYNCCDPSNDVVTKNLCERAAKDADNVLWDVAGNKHIFIWRGCAGEE